MTYDNWKLDVPPHYNLPEQHPLDCSDNYGQIIEFLYEDEGRITGLVVGYTNKSVFVQINASTYEFEYNKMKEKNVLR